MRARWAARLARTGLPLVVGGTLWAAACSVASAQLSLSSAVALALKDSPKVRMAESDVAKARAALSEARDAYVPSVNTSGGIGESAGVPLEVPVVFTVSARSLVFNSSQPDYIRAARAGLTSATLALSEVQSAVAEDVVATYIGLDNALQRRAAVKAALEDSGDLARIVQQRFDAGVEAHIEVTRSLRTGAQIRLQDLVLDDEIASLANHLAKLTGVPGSGAATIHDSIPALTPAPPPTDGEPDSDGIKSAFAQVSAKEYTAHGDQRYLLHPQVYFGAGYSRVSTVGTNYGQYYPKFNTDNPANSENSLNSLSIGVQISVPILDLIHGAKAREARADAARSRFEAEDQRNQFLEGRAKLRNTVKELEARAEIARLDRDFSQDQLDAIELQLKGDTSALGTQLSPKDAANGRLQERQRFLDMLTADLQLKQSEITLMRETGSLGEWLHTTLEVTPTTPGVAVLPAR